MKKIALTRLFIGTIIFTNFFLAGAALAAADVVTLSVVPCTIGLGKSATSPNNALTCDAKVSWSTSGVDNAYVVITGDIPYNASSFPYGFAIAPGLSGNNQPFWVTSGIYRAALYVNGSHPTLTTAGTGTKVKEVVFRVGATDAKVLPATVVGLVSNKTSEWTQGPALLSNFVNMYNGHVQVEPEVGNEYPFKMWFFGWAANLCNNPNWPNGTKACDAIFYARSKDGVAWQVYSGDGASGAPTFDTTQNPALWKAIISSQNLYYDKIHNGDPAVVKVGGHYFMVYSAVGTDKDDIEGGILGDTDGYFSGIMGAVSDDGIHWERTTKPFLVAPGEYGGKDNAPGNMYHRPSLLYEGGVFRLWFDYWISDNFGLGMGYAEMSATATRSSFLNGNWNILRAGDNPLIVGWPNPNVIKVGNLYYSYADPVVTADAGVWESRKITEATSPDGVQWTVTGSINPDSNCTATHVPEAYLLGNKLTVTYGCQKEGNSSNNYHYKQIRSMSKVVDAVGPVLPTYKGYVERFTKKAENLYTLTGWVCAVGSPVSVPVTIAFGGVAWKTVMASSSSEVAVATACNSVGTKYRFNIAVNAETLRMYAGKTVTAKVFGTSITAPSSLVVPSATLTPVRGSVDGFTKTTNGVQNLSGWACREGDSSSVSVDIFFGSTKWLSTTTAYRNEPAVATACKSTGTNHRFFLPLSSQVLEQYRGQAVSVKVGTTSISASGRYVVPAPASSTPATPCSGVGCASTSTAAVGTISLIPCTLGLGKSTINPNNPDICDQFVSWSTQNAADVKLVISGDLPYTSASFPGGYTAGAGQSGTATFWVTNGTYTATLYNGTTTLAVKNLVVSLPATEPQEPAGEGENVSALFIRSSLSQIANVLGALRQLLGL